MKWTDRIVFFGTPSFAIPSLSALLQSGRKVSLVVTQPDRPAGRGMKLKPSEVKEFALQNKLPVSEPTKLKSETFLRQLKEAEAEVYVVAAYGRILPRALLDLPKFTLNVHASLLPRWRGASPIQRSILNGDGVTGVSIMKLVEELDAGDVGLQAETPIGNEETYGELEQRLSVIGASALVEALDKLEAGKLAFAPQNASKVTLAPPLTSTEGEIDWEDSADNIHRKVYAFNPWPGAFTWDANKRIKIQRTRTSEFSSAAVTTGKVAVDKGKLFVRCKEGWIEILELQVEGKSVQTAQVFLTGYRNAKDAVWGSRPKSG